MSRWVLEKSFTFEASHQLPHHDGKCARLHGHSWKGTVILEGDTLEDDGPKRSMLVDYGDVSRKVKPLVDNCLDHHHLNDTTGLESPTSEEIARWVFDHLKQTFPDLKAVRIEETCTSACTYQL